MKRRIHSIALPVLAALLSCGPSHNTSTPTSGSAFLYVSSSVEDLSSALGRAFEGQYPETRIDIAPLPASAAVDSLLYGIQQQIIIDRPLAPAESLAFAERGVPLFQYRVATLPLYFAVHAENAVLSVDSVALRRFLTGEWKSWSDAGGPDVPCRVYAPPPGEGGWNACTDYFGDLDMSAAVVCSTAADLLALAEADPGALAIVPVPIARTSLRKLRWKSGAVEIPPNIKTIAEEPRYPFRLAVTYITNRQKTDAAAGFLTFIVSNAGQQAVADAGYRPATIPVRIIEMF